MHSLRKAIEVGYDQNAQNCWIAALLYLITLCVSAQQNCWIAALLYLITLCVS